MKYYEQEFTVPNYSDLKFKIQKCNSVELLGVQTLYAKALTSTDTNINDLSKCYDYILNNMLFSENNKDFISLKSKGSDSCNLSLIDDDMGLMFNVIQIFINNVLKSLFTN